MKNIMLVDDQSIANLIMRKFIEMKLQGYQVTDFTNPAEALQQLNRVSPHLIFLDLNMPEISGWDFLDKMQEQKLDYKVVVLTSSTSQLDREKAETYSNVIAYYEKPFKPEELHKVDEWTS